MASENMAERKRGHSPSISEIDTEMKLSVSDPLQGIEEVKETEVMDIVTDNICNN